MKTLKALKLVFILNLLSVVTYASFQSTAENDSAKYANKTGIYQVTVDGQIRSSGSTPCTLARDITADAAKYSMSFSINIPLGDGTYGSVPGIIYYIFSTGEYKETTGAYGQADRSVSEAGAIVYSNPTMSYEDLRSCGSWGHVGKPTFGLTEDFVLGADYVQYVAKYKCEVFGGQIHQITKTCKF